MANPKKAASSASAPTSAPASVGAPPSDAISPLSDLAAAMAEDESDETAEKPALVSATPSLGEHVASLLASEGLTLRAGGDDTIVVLPADLPLGADAARFSEGATLTDVAQGGTVLTVLPSEEVTVLPSEEVTDLKNKVVALLDDLDAANARVDRYKNEALDATAKLAVAHAQIELMDGQLTGLDAENKALRNGAPAAVKPTPAVKPASIPEDFDLLTWTGPGVYEGLCFKLTGESLPRARGAMTGWFPKSMARKFPTAFVKAA